METGDGEVTQVVLLPLLMGGRRPGVRHPLPRVGQHTEEILAGLPSHAAAPFQT
jgi:formyl-CoA transferase